MAYSSQDLTFVYHGITSHIPKGKNILWQNQTNMLLHLNIKIMAFKLNMFIFIIKATSYFQTNACSCITYLTASQHPHINAFHMHVYGKTEEKTLTSIKGVKNAKQRSRDL